jgi:hypothetical protein
MSKINKKFKKNLTAEAAEHAETFNISQETRNPPGRLPAEPG